MSRTHNSDSRSESASLSVTTVSIAPDTLPALGQVKIVPASVGHKAIFNTGGALGCVEAYGKSEIEAYDAALRLAARLFIEHEARRSDALDFELSHEPSESAFDDEDCEEPGDEFADMLATFGGYTY